MIPLQSPVLRILSKQLIASTDSEILQSADFYGNKWTGTDKALPGSYLWNTKKGKQPPYEMHGITLEYNLVGFVMIWGAGVFSCSGFELTLISAMIRPCGGDRDTAKTPKQTDVDGDLDNLVAERRADGL